jgi:integrase
VSLFKRNGSWFIDYRFPPGRTGRRIREKVGPSKQEAEIVLATRLQDIRHGKNPELRTIKPRLFEDIAVEFLGTYVGISVEVIREDGTIKLRKSGIPGPAMKRDPDTYLHNVTLLLRRFDGLTLQGITTKGIEEFIRARLADGVAKSTTNRQRNTLGRIVTWAIDRGYFSGENPVCKVKRFPEPMGPGRCITADQAALLLEKIESRFRLLLLAALHTGCRRSDLLKLTWADLDLDKRLATFREGKNGEDRVVPLSATLTAELKRLPRPIQGGPVFRSEDGEAMKPGLFRDAFKAATVAAGIQGFRWHDARHTAATTMLAEGVPPTTVMAVCGWKTMAMLRRYNHALPGHLRVAADAMDRVATAGDARRAGKDRA